MLTLTLMLALMLMLMLMFWFARSHLLKVMDKGSVKTFTHERLTRLQALFHLHVLLNKSKELAAQKCVPHRDFYNVRKVDTHVHHSAIMTQKHLVRPNTQRAKRICFVTRAFISAALLGRVLAEANHTAVDVVGG